MRTKQKERYKVMKIYNNQNTQMSVISGKIESIAEDRLSLSVKSEKYVHADNARHEEILPVSVDTPLGDDYSVGQDVTIVSFFNARSKMHEAMYIGNKSGYYEEEEGKLCVIHGEVMYAGYNEEKNEDGTKKMTKERRAADGSIEEPHEKKPHFDIAIATTEPDPNSNQENATRRVLHVIKVYPKKNRDKDGNETGGVDNSQIEGLKRQFRTFDRKEKPAIVTVATRPGTEWSYEKEYNGTVYNNVQVSHIGFNSLDMTYIQAREKTQQQTAQQEAPAQAQPQQAAPAQAAPIQDDEIPFAADAPVQNAAPAADTQAQAGSGFSASAPEEDEEMDTAGMFLDN